MPRTKVAKSTAKRVREGEDACDLVIKNFETRGKHPSHHQNFVHHFYPFLSSSPVNFIYQDIEYKYNEQYAKLDEELETFRNAIPVEILDMRLSDLKRMVRTTIFGVILQYSPYLLFQAFPTFADVKKYLDAEKNLNSTVHLDMSIRDEGKDHLHQLLNCFAYVFHKHACYDRFPSLPSYHFLTGHLC